MHDGPLDDEVAALRVGPTDDDTRTVLENRVGPPGDSLERELQFGGIVVSLAKSAVSNLCELDDVERIETVDTLGYWFFAHAYGTGVLRGEWCQPSSVFSVEVTYGPSPFPRRAIRIRRTVHRLRDCDSPRGVLDGTVSVFAGLGGTPLLVVYLLLLTDTAAQYRRRKLSGTWAVLLVGMYPTWLSCALLQVTQSRTVPTGTSLNYILDTLAVTVLVVGVATMGWW